MGRQSAQPGLNWEELRREGEARSHQAISGGIFAYPVSYVLTSLKPTEEPLKEVLFVLFCNSTAKGMRPGFSQLILAEYSAP